MTQKQTKYFKNDQLTYFEIDAKDQILGRLSTVIASILRGKCNPKFTPNVAGDCVIVVNAEKVRLTGKKSEQKIYHKYSGFIGGGSKIPIAEMKPNLVIMKAVWGMLPKTKLGRAMQRNLKVYTGSDHPHVAQKPIKLES